MSVFEEEDQQTVKGLFYGFIGISGLTIALILLALAITG
jgi:hypothetical protein